LSISNFGLGDEAGSYRCSVNYDGPIRDDSSLPLSLDLLGKKIKRRYIITVFRYNCVSTYYRINIMCTGSGFFKN
jgi:hypothetical protein